MQSTRFVIALLLVGFTTAIVAGLPYLAEYIDVQRVEAEARREDAAASRVTAETELTRAAGERAILEASADAVRADTGAAHTGADGWMLMIAVLCTVATVLLFGVVIRATYRQQDIFNAPGTHPQLTAEMARLQHSVLYWRRAALTLAAMLRARPALTEAEQRALAFTDAEARDG